MTNIVRTDKVLDGDPRIEGTRVGRIQYRCQHSLRLAHQDL